MTNIVSCCTSGKPASDDYKPKGQFTDIGDLHIYTSGQTNASSKVLLILPDGFGLARHNLILADRFAEKLGCRAIVPDYFEGDALPVELLKYRPSPGVAIDDHDWPEGAKQKIRNTNLELWLKKHPHERIYKILEGLVSSLRSAAPEVQFVGIGYCFGGKHVLQMAKYALTAAVAFHPSFVVHDDLKGLKIPLYVGLAQNDVMVPASLPQDLDIWTKQENAKATLETYPNVGHGFAARPETEDPLVAEQYQHAFDAAVALLQQYVRSN